jgi:uncharacterized phage protein gp47/JayE
MARQILNYQAPPAITAYFGDSLPNPGIVGVIAWSSTENALITWEGVSWQKLSIDEGAIANQVTSINIIANTIKTQRVMAEMVQRGQV